MEEGIKSSVLQQDVITGFSYSFCEALFQKLRQLWEDDKVFPGGVAKATRERNRESGEGRDLSLMTPVPIARTVIEYLGEQVRFSIYVGTIEPSPSDIQTLIKLTEEFLAIFKKK